ncbi:MAG TPA: four helix bundle protein [Opitutaceae bacterium]|nr:four helix bundle protein [Opitutaceae bacterium]
MANIDANRKLEERTLSFAVAVIRFVASFPPSDAARIVVRQLVKAGTAIGANYREANRAESKDDFVHKTAIVLKEASEADYWLELCSRTDLGDAAQRSLLAQEGRELLAIFTTINRNAKGR